MESAFERELRRTLASMPKGEPDVIAVDQWDRYDFHQGPRRGFLRLRFPKSFFPWIKPPRD